MQVFEKVGFLGKRLIIVLFSILCLSMEERNQAKHLYRKCIDNDNLGDESLADLKNSVLKLLKKALNNTDHRPQNMYKQFVNVIISTVKSEKFVANETSEAFRLLEKYFILLYRYPWKKEFHRLKTYCGFFQCRIKSYLENPEAIFKLAEFNEEKNDNNILTLKKKCNPDLALAVAFECVMASVECDLIVEYYMNNKDKGCDWLDAAKFRLEGLVPDFTKKPREHLVLMSKHQHPGLNFERGVDSGAVANGGFIGKGMPFIDEDNTTEVQSDFQVGTVDDHMMASLQKLKAAPCRTEFNTTSKSEEWNFVRSGLVNKYGEHYYDGVRGDVIHSNSRHDAARSRQLRDNLSDEGIDVDEHPPPVRIEELHRPLRPLDPTLPPPSVDYPGKSMQTSGYRTGGYQSVAYPPKPCPDVVCDNGPVSTRPSASNMKYDYNIPTKNPAVYVARGRDVIAKNNSSAYSNTSNLENIELMARGTARMERFAERRQKSDTWICQSCSMSNSACGICRTCGKSRTLPRELDEYGVGESVRVCQKCTLENKPGSLVCSACNTVLVTSNINTYV